MGFRLVLLMWVATVLVAPVDEKPNLVTAKKHFFARRFQEAEKTLRALVGANSEDVAARYLLVRTLIESNQPEAALKEAEAAVERSPSQAFAKLALGDARFRLADFEAAFAAYQEARDLPRGLLGMGRVHYSDFRLRKAGEQFAVALAVDPNDPDIALAVSSVMPRSASQLSLEEQFVTEATYRDPEELEGTKAFISLFRLKEAGPSFVPKDRPDTTTIQLEGRPPHTTIPTAFLLPVSINNGEPRKLLIDTGAHGILVSSRLARLDSVKSQVPYRLGGLGSQGRLPASLGWADSIKIGETAFGGGPVVITEKPIAPMWEGIIGADVLRDFVITLDFPKGVLRLAKLTDSGADGQAWDRAAELRPGFTQLRLADGKLLVPVKINGRAQCYFILDTGAARSLIDRKLAKTVSQLTVTKRKIDGVAGRVEDVLKTEELVLEFGGIQHRESLLAVDFSQVSYALGVEVGGVIGCGFLRNYCLTVDYRNGLVKFERGATP